MSTHTPEPWYVEVDHATGAAEYIRAYWDKEMFDIASVLCDETGSANANASLIAAAPELLAALENARNLIALAIANGAWGDKSTDDADSADDADSVLTQIDAAIAKATGAA
jgi:hypothetical protein